MDTIAELFSRRILDRPHTDEEIDQMIAYLREKRAAFVSGVAAKAAKAPKVQGKSFTLDDLGL